MLKNKFILLSVIGVLYSVGINGAFASREANSTASDENISTEASDACKGRNEGDGCMYIKDDTKFIGVCQKHDDKLNCTTIKQ